VFFWVENFRVESGEYQKRVVVIFFNRVLIGELDYRDERVECMSAEARDANIQKLSFMCS